MRKYQQKQILELLKTIEEAQEAELYADCQDCALVVGEFIEELKGEGTETVALLEEYCEIVYKASIGEAGIKALKKQLLRVENSVKNELKPTHYEMIFLSYKASMSDSIESIYMAAKEDPDCDAYWIPIPYYEHGTDGKPKTLIYEGQEFYKSIIECTDYHEYNIEERHPDAIFTFAPYDELNQVTTIHPDFYTKKLRTLTDLLVYVPYFVSCDFIEEPFTKCFGILCSHITVVQSEAVRQCYIHDYKDMELLGYSREVYGAPEDKIVALGSPKFDAVINAKRDDFTLSEQWKTLIKGKKVIFFNTSVGELINGDEQYIKKLQFVLDTFRNRNDVILWWRPHPLSDTAYSSLKPELADEYKNIVKKYEKDSFGIYDESPDLHRAIAWSDAYYGDWSSIVLLYQCLQKPIMMKNNETDNKGKGNNILYFHDLYDDGVHLWFTAGNYNALLKIDKQSFAIDYIGRFPDYKITDTTLYTNIIGHNGKLYFTPYYANNIAVYDPISNEFSSIPLPESMVIKEFNETIKGKFWYAASYKKYIFFFGLNIPAILRLDTNTGHIDQYSDWVVKIEGLQRLNNIYLFSRCIIKHKVILPIYGTNIVIIFNMETCTSELHKIGSKNIKLYSVCYDGVHCWFSPVKDAPIIKWNLNTSEYKELNDFPNGFKYGEYSFPNILYAGDYIWLIPHSANMALKINIKTEQIEIAKEFQKVCDYMDDLIIPFNYFMARSTNEKIFALTGKTLDFIEYDLKSGQQSERKVVSPNIAMEKLNEAHFNNVCVNSLSYTDPDKCLIGESSSLTLKDFINSVVNNNTFLYDTSIRQAELRKKMLKNYDGTSGQKIYNYCKARMQ